MKKLIAVGLILALSVVAIAGSTQEADRLLTAFDYEQLCVDGMESNMREMVLTGQITQVLGTALVVEMRKPHRLRELRVVVRKTLSDRYTESELKAFANFFSSRAGQRWLKDEVGRMRAMNDAAFLWGEGVGRGVGERMMGR